jgi:hypothetical protein
MYGENSGHLRDAMGALLREHRIQQRLGGKEPTPFPRPPPPRNAASSASRSAATANAC